jgi:type IX secretion system PorP/SprF family membrane protein
MRRFLCFVAGLVLIVAVGSGVHAQGLHFSQFYNAPLLLSPANAALMPDKDFRIGANYRNQWSSLPVPFRTVSAYGDFQLFRDVAQTNWLGIGASFFSDRAGNGQLSLVKAQLSAAYHLQLNDYNMISVGLGAAFVQRSVDFSRLTFDTQWDGFTFDPRQANGEGYAFQKTSYPDIIAGINYALFPNENVYMKLGIGLLHINRPSESFYKMDNKLGMRPTANLDILLRMSESWIANVSAYYSSQKNASETVFGTSFTYKVGAKENMPDIFIMGAYYRMGDALIPMFGFEWSNIRVTANMDIPISGIAPSTGANGAFELSLIYQGVFSAGAASRDSYNCPRF